MKKDDLEYRLLDRAWQLARENYGCGLDRLDEEEVQWYLDRLTEANFEETASDLAYAGWFAN